MNRLPSLFFSAAVASCVLASNAHAANSLVIHNDTLQVQCDPQRGEFSITRLGVTQPFVPAGTLLLGGGRGKVVATNNQTFGAGHSIEITSARGGSSRIMLFPKLPFVLFQSVLHNGGNGAIDTNRVGLISAPVDLGGPPGRLTSLGTGGLLELEKNTGSYAYLAIADPSTRAGVVGGWLTHDRGSGVVFSPVTNGVVRMEARIDYGRLRLKPGTGAATEVFALGFFDDGRLGLEAYADAVAKVYSIQLPPQPAGYCTWYADKHGRACDEQHIVELAEFAARALKPFGFDFVQIDDQWQAGISTNGPKRVFMTNAADGPYPSGMKAAAAGIDNLGLMPGIWFMPFAGTSYDPCFTNHLDWFYRDKSGRPFETRWGGTCLDMTVSGARNHLKQLVHRLAHEWGYKIFKMDGLWTGTGTRLMYVNNGYKWDEMGEATTADPDKTQIEAFRDGLKLVRQEAGPDVFLLGCCVSQNMRSFGGAFGLVDAMRVGPDTGAGEIGALHASRNYFLHGRVWLNDPDCVSVRTRATLDQARVNASFTAITGDLFYNSDWMPDLPADRLDILKRCLPAHGLVPRPVDYFEHDPARIWLLTDARQSPRRDVVALFNWDKAKSTTISCTTDRIGLPAAKEFVAFDFWADKFVPPFKDTLRAELRPASCRVLAVRPAASHPQVLSTSRHVSQGIVDLIEEQWDPDRLTLSGTSRVVAADPYELRLIVPTGTESFAPTDVPISPEDAAAGVETAFKQDGPKIRVSLLSTSSRDIRWQVKFRKASVEAPAPRAVANLMATADVSGVSLTWEDNGADRYNVVRGDGSRFNCASPRFADTTAELGRQYRYRVSAIGWDGSASVPAEVEIAMPAELRRPPIPPLPTVYLNDLKPITKQVGWGKLGINKSVAGQPLTVDGKRYRQGVGCHANSLLVYSIPKNAHRFVAMVGLDDEKEDDPRSSVIFEIHGDVNEMGEEPVLLAKSPRLSNKTIRSWAFDVDLDPRFRQLRLVVTDADDGNASDHADWVEAGFITRK